MGGAQTIVDAPPWAARIPVEAYVSADCAREVRDRLWRREFGGFTGWGGRRPAQPHRLRHR